MGWSRGLLKEALHRAGVQLKRDLGQNFLLDPNFLEFMVRRAEIHPTDYVIEIGAGVGTLTELLAKRAKHVWAFELDPELFKICKEYLGARTNLTLLNQDALCGLDQIRSRADIKLVSNPPYTHIRDLMIKILTHPLPIQQYWITVQREVYQRFVAQPSSLYYCPLSVVVQTLCKVKLIRTVPPDLFYPRPRCGSVYVWLAVQQGIISKQELAKLVPVLYRLFSYRRKMLANVLRHLGIKDILSHGIQHRIEEFHPHALLEIARQVSRKYRCKDSFSVR